MNYRQAKKINKRIDRDSIFSFELADKVQAATGFSDAKFNKTLIKKRKNKYYKLIMINPNKIYHLL